MSNISAISEYLSSSRQPRTLAKVTPWLPLEPSCSTMGMKTDMSPILIFSPIVGRPFHSLDVLNVRNGNAVGAA
jgi:hypothetical protein